MAYIPTNNRPAGMLTDLPSLMQSAALPFFRPKGRPGYSRPKSGSDCGCAKPVRDQASIACSTLPQLGLPCFKYTYAKVGNGQLPPYWSSSPISTATQQVIDDCSIAKLALDQAQVTVSGVQNPTPFVLNNSRWVANVTNATPASVPCVYIDFSYNRLQPIPQNVIIRISTGDTASNPGGAITGSQVNEITLAGYSDGLGFQGLAINSTPDVVQTQRRVFIPFTLSTVGIVLTGYRVEVYNAGVQADSLIGSVKSYVSSDIIFNPFQRYVNRGASNI